MLLTKLISSESNTMSYWMLESEPTKLIEYPSVFAHTDGSVYYTDYNMGFVFKVDNQGVAYPGRSSNWAYVAHNAVELPDGSLRVCGSIFGASAITSLTLSASLASTSNTSRTNGASNGIASLPLSGGDYYEVGINGYARKTLPSTIVWNSVIAYQLFSAVTDSSDNLYTVGVISDGVNKPVVTKINSSGTVVWCKKITPVTGAISGTGFEPRCIDVDSSGNVYLAFRFNSTTIAILKLDSSGAVVWRVNHTVTSSSSGVHIYVRGTSVYVMYLSAASIVPVLVVLNTSGTQTAARQFTCTGISMGGYLLPHVSKDGASIAIVMRGYQTTYASGTHRYVILKLDPTNLPAAATYGTVTVSVPTVTTATANHTVADYTFTPSGSLTSQVASPTPVPPPLLTTL